MPLTHEGPALTEEYAELYKSYDTAERVLERYAFERVSGSLLTILPVYVIVSEKDYHDARNHGCTTVSETEKRVLLRLHRNYMSALSV